MNRRGEEALLVLIAALNRSVYGTIRPLCGVIIRETWRFDNTEIQAWDETSCNCFMNFIIDMIGFTCMSEILIQDVSVSTRSDFISAHDQSELMEASTKVKVLKFRITSSKESPYLRVFKDVM